MVHGLIPLMVSENIEIIFGLVPAVKPFILLTKN